MLDTQNPVLAARSILASRAMLRGVRISQWDGRKLDKAVSEEVNRTKNAERDVSRLNKRLVPDSALKRIESAASAARAVHKRYCLPWTDNGLDILPASFVMTYDSEMRAARLEFESAVDGFLANYPNLVASAPLRMGDLYKAADFPDVADLRSRFSLRVRTLPMPDASDFRVDMADAQARMIRAEIEQESREALQHAMADAWQRVSAVCSRMVERLNAYQPASGNGERASGIFRDSLVENVRDLVALLPSFNLTNDPTLAVIASRLESDLCSHTAAELRDDSRLREETAKAAQSILEDVSAYLA